MPKLIKGMKALQVLKATPKVLPPVFLWRLHCLHKPEPIHIAIQMQAALGLRAAHFVMLKRHNFWVKSVLLPPFKKRTSSTLLPTDHIPPALLEAYFKLQPASSPPSSVILPFWTPAQYKQKFTNATRALGLNHATHSARHTFASIQAAKGTPRGTLAAYLLHYDDKTTGIYVHELSPEDLRCVLEHPEYFRTCSMLLPPAARPKVVN